MPSMPVIRIFRQWTSMVYQTLVWKTLAGNVSWHCAVPQQNRNLRLFVGLWLSKTVWVCDDVSHSFHGFGFEIWGYAYDLHRVNVRSDVLHTKVTAAIDCGRATQHLHHVMLLVWDFWPQYSNDSHSEHPSALGWKIAESVQMCMSSNYEWMLCVLNMNANVSCQNSLSLTVWLWIQTLDFQSSFHIQSVSLHQEWFYLLYIADFQIQFEFRSCWLMKPYRDMPWPWP